MMRQNVGYDDEFSNVDSGEPLILLEAGIYPAQWIDRTMKPYHLGGEKLIFTWKVFTSIHFRDPAMSSEFVSLPAYYNIKRNKANRLAFGPHHSYRKDWIAANDGRHPQPRSSLPLIVFQERFLFVRVTTVTVDYRGSIHTSCYWSKVSGIIRPVREDDVIRRLPLELDEIA
jgi:hypothetical protein